MNENGSVLFKALDAPLLALDDSHVELFSLLALFLLTLVAMVVKGRFRQWVRHLVQFSSVLVFFYIVYSCLGVFGMIRNVMHGITLVGSIFTEAFFWMSLPLAIVAFSITSGPYFCGWICPTGTFQELFTALRKKVFYKRPSPNRLEMRAWSLVLLGLCFLGFVVLVLYLGTTKRFYVEDSSLYWASALMVLVFMVMTRTVSDQAIRALRTVSFSIILTSALLKTAIISPMHFAFADTSDPASALTTLVLVVAAVFVSRAWCRYLCPWGYLMGCISRVSRLRVAAAGSCENCGLCQKLCSVEAIQGQDVKIDQCQFCLACVDRCPSGNLEVIDTWRRFPTPESIEDKNPS
jgi:polyferredoxin